MSLRARLALVLAGVLAGPLVAAGLVVGVVVPRARADADRAALARAASTASAYLAQECVALGDVARGVALDLAGSVAAGRTVTGDSAGAAAAAALRGHDDIGLIVLVDGAPVDAGRRRPRDLGPGGRRRGAARAAARLVQPGIRPGRGPPCPRRVGARAVHRRWAGRAGPRRPGPGRRRGRAAAVQARPGCRPARAAPGAAPSGGVRYESAPAAAGVPYRLVAWMPAGQPDPVRVVLVAVALVAVLASAVLLSVVTARLTTPLRRLTAAAGRLRAGDLSAAHRPGG